MTTDTTSASMLSTVLRRPGTLLLGVLVADTAAAVVSDSVKSTLGLVFYGLQALLLYRIWRGANFVPWLLLLALAGIQASAPLPIVRAGLTAEAPALVAVHLIAAAVTAVVLLSPPVRRRISPLRGVRPRNRP